MFAGGFDLQSACAVAGSDDLDDYVVLDLLDALVRKSLLVADRSTGRTRFSMLETIRQFGEEHLVAGGAAEEVRTAHARHFAGKEADILALWDGPRQREAYSWLTVEMPNLRTAFRWAADHNDLDTAATIAHYAAFVGFWGEQHEPIRWAEELIEPARAVQHRRLAQLYADGGAVLHGRKDRRRRRLCRGWPGSRHQRTLRRSPQGRRSDARRPYSAIGQPGRWVEWCRTVIARRSRHECPRSGIVGHRAEVGRCR